ncbi:MAG TPA: hypothetical protein PKW55_05095 [Spirochaetota bacterium]|nr:hypothetical protein [Spirochaetota bacterium]HOM37672.1 hypothetical protein [Spirochaetota bacterium]HPQ49630.1 hypothetical protein [Spirochaetota bacterium]
MKKFFLLTLSLLLIVSCGKREFSDPKELLKEYTAGLQKGEFYTDMWDLTEFAKIYYDKYIATASKEDLDRLISNIEKFSKTVAKLNQKMASNSYIESMEIVEDKPDLKKITVVYSRKQTEEEKNLKLPKVSLGIVFVLKKYGETWKIINYERMMYAERELDIVKTFKENLPNMLKDAGYNPDTLTLKQINDFFETKILNPQKEVNNK